MRTCNTGRVGDPSFLEAIRTFVEGRRRVTLFVLNGDDEKLLHSSPSGCRVLISRAVPEEFPEGDPARTLLERRSVPSEGKRLDAVGDDVAPQDGASGCESSELRAAARELLIRDLETLVTWTGARFELREGPLPTALEEDARILELSYPVADLLAGWKAPKIQSTASGGKRRRAPLETVRELHARTSGSYCKSLVLLELEEAWNQLGESPRASQCLREIACEYVEWRLTRSALETLERALEGCPVDLCVCEDAVLLYQSEGQKGEAEKIAERLFQHLEQWKQYEAIARFYKLFERGAESASLRRLGGEGLIRTGETERGIREILAAASTLEKSRDAIGAIKLYEHILEIDPSESTAQKALGRIRSSKVFRLRCLRWGSVACSVLLMVGWFFWDAASVQALKRLEATQDSSSLKAQILLLSNEADGFPVTWHSRRLLELQSDLYRKAFRREHGELAKALAKQSEGRNEEAEALFDRFLEESIVLPFRERARLGKSEAQERGREREALIEKAMDHVQARRFRQAFEVFRRVLKDADRERVESGLYVPVLVETAPAGATISVNEVSVGSTPSWVFLPSDPDSILRLELHGLEPFELNDPLGALVESDQYRLRIALGRPLAWKQPSFSCVFARGLATDAQLIPCMGADEVLRCIDPDSRVLWERPFAIPIGPRLDVVIVGPCIVIAPGNHDVFGFSLESGKLTWSTRLSKDGSPAVLGDSYRGQLLTVSEGRPKLVNPRTGLLVRIYDLGGERATGVHSLVGNTGYFCLDGGGLASVNLQTGSLKEVRWKAVGRIERIVPRQPDLLVVATADRVAALRPGQDDPLWSKEFTTPPMICGIDKDLVCIARRTGEILCLNATTGVPAWGESVVGELSEVSSFGDESNKLFVKLRQDGNQFLGKLDGASGEVAWELDAGPVGLLSLHDGGETVFVSTAGNGTCAVLDAGD